MRWAATPPSEREETSIGRAEHHPNRSLLRGRGYFKRLGPGLITGAADDDPSGIGTYSQVGASLRFDLLWTTLISLPLAAAVLELSARLGLITGKGLAAVVRERFPRIGVYPTVFVVVVANTFTIGADLGSMAASLRLLIPVPQLVALVAIAAAVAVLEVRIPYERYARVLRLLVLSLVAYIGVLASVRVPWGEVAARTLLPRLQADKEHLAALIAIFGTTISPYLFFWQAGEEVEEQGNRRRTSVRRTSVQRSHLRAMRIDVVVGITAGVVVMFAILTAAAVTLGEQGVRDIETADQAAQALRPLAGDLARLLFTLGIVGTGLLAVPVLAGSSAYALAEAFHWREGLSRTFRQAPGFYGVIVAGIAIGAALNFFGVNPIRALYLSAILNGLAATPILIFMLLTARGRILGRHKSGWLSLALSGAAVLIMTALPIWYLLA